jgi:hypothetical protein
LEWIAFEEPEAQETSMDLMPVLERSEIVDERCALDGRMYVDHLSGFHQRTNPESGPQREAQTTLSSARSLQRLHYCHFLNDLNFTMNIKECKIQPF